jgi:hypothetical protein
MLVVHWFVLISNMMRHSASFLFLVRVWDHDKHDSPTNNIIEL